VQQQIRYIYVAIFVKASAELRENIQDALYSLTRDFLSAAIVADRGEFRMTEVVIERPFKELDRRDQLRLEPAASLHVFSSESFALAALSRLGQIGERAFFDLKTAE
jgi:hypothetical protein